MASPCANPQFLEWIGEWMDHARQNNHRTYYTYKRAYDAMARYPTKFEHPSETICLSGVGEKLVGMLESKMIEYCSSMGIPMPAAKKRRGAPAGAGDPSESGEGEAQEGAPPKKPRKKSSRAYVPAVRSGPYAILMALFNAQGGHGYLLREDIIARGQPLCDSSFDIPDHGKFFTAWNSMKTLLDKGLVYKSSSSPAKYTLTDEGRSLTEKIQSSTGGATPSTSSGTVGGLSSSSFQIASSPTPPPVLSIRKETSVSRKSRAYSVETLSDTDADVTLEDIDEYDRGISVAKASTHDWTTALDSSSKLRSSFEEYSFLKNSPSLRSSSNISTTSSSTLVSSVSSTSSRVVTTAAASADLGFPDFRPIRLRPGSFEVIMILDNREVRVKEDRDYILLKLQEQCVAVEQRSLDLGDVLWVARLLSPGSNEPPEVVLDYVLERKRMDDLAASIVDGRYQEQKQRLLQSGMGQVIYLVENYRSDEGQDMRAEAIRTAMGSMQMVNGFFLKRTTSTDDTIEYLTGFTKMIKEKYEKNELVVIPDHAVDRESHLEHKEWLSEKYPETVFHTSYQAYETLNTKSESLNLQEIFVKMLMTIKGMNVERAADISNTYTTPREFYLALQEREMRDGSSSESDEASSTTMSSSQQINTKHSGSAIGRKKIGPALHERLVKIWSADSYE